MLVLSKTPFSVDLLDSEVRVGDSSALIAVVVSTAGLPPKSSLKSSILSGVTWSEMKIESTKIDEVPPPEHVSEMANVGESEKASTC